MEESGEEIRNRRPGYMGVNDRLTGSVLMMVADDDMVESEELTKPRF
jgi:hypothetical protein